MLSVQNAPCIKIIVLSISLPQTDCQALRRGDRLALGGILPSDFWTHDGQNRIEHQLGQSEEVFKSISIPESQLLDQPVISAKLQALGQKLPCPAGCPAFLPSLAIAPIQISDGKHSHSCWCHRKVYLTKIKMSAKIIEGNHSSRL